MNLASKYAGVEVSSPVLIGASPIALDIDNAKKLADHGAGAIVMPSIFEEQITAAQFGKLGGTVSLVSDDALCQSLPKSGTSLDDYNGGADGYLRNIEAAKSSIAIPVIGSVNCVTTGNWMRYARDIQNAGADAIELNLYHYLLDPHRFAEDVEKELVERVRNFCDESKLPVAVKVLPQFTCLPNVAYRIAGAGAQSLCLFGQSPMLSAQKAEHINYRWRLTTLTDLRTTLEGIHQVRGAVHNLTLAASGGIQSPADALAAIQLGADVVMLTSAVYRQGSEIITEIREALVRSMSERNLLSLQELIGSQRGGYNPFPESTRRQEYSSSIADFSSRSDGLEAK